MTSFQELRNLALEARKENSTDRQSRYIKARDEAFEVLTDGVIEKIQNAAKEGRFRYPIYRWTNQPRSQKATDQPEDQTEDPENVSTPEATQLYFGNDESGKNGLHIMALMQPTGIPYKTSLVSKLRDFFNSRISSEESSDGEKGDRLRVFLQRRPTNTRQCAIFVSWEKNQVPAEIRRGVPATRGLPQVIGQRQFPVKRTESSSPSTAPAGVRTPRGQAPVRGQAPTRGTPRVGRGGSFGAPRVA